jgi:CHAD domain-containing protein
MNRASLFLIDRTPDETFRRQWQQQLAGWQELLALCGKKPGRKRVHGLRTATLRVQALLEFWLGTHEHEPAAHAVKRWNKQAAKLRRALQPARSAEVCRGKVAGLRAALLRTRGVDGAAPGPDCMRQIRELERRFARQCDSAEKELVEKIDGRRERLERWGKEIAKSIAAPVVSGGVSGAEVVRERIKGLAAEFPTLSAECLHEYRRRIKNLRYLAEFLSASDPRAERQASILGRIQTAVGEWRDWQMLAQEAQKRFEGEESVLADLLAAREAKTLERALRLCRRSRERLLEAGDVELMPPKKPVQSVRPGDELNKRLPA